MQLINNDIELAVTLERIRWLQEQLSTLRKTETNPLNY